jgi:hypothetical protein
MGRLLFLSAICMSAHAQQSAQVLADILEERGVIAHADRARIRSAAPDDAVQMIAVILRDKGMLNGADLTRIGVVNAAPAPMQLTPAVYTAPQQQTAPRPAADTNAINPFPIKVYGTLLMNSFYNTSLNNNQDVPLFAGKQGTDPTGGDKNFGMTVRQSRFGMRYQGPRIDGGQVSGQFEFDLFGGQSTLPNGTAGFDLFRLRLALGRIDWKNFSLIAGQDWSVFAPLNPTSLAGYAIPDLAASGNLWIRSPQIRAELRHDLSDKAQIQFAVAATDPNVGDNSATFATARTAGIGERGRTPGVDSRLSVTSGGVALGLSAHYSRGKNAGMIGTRNVETGVDSWGVAGDYTIPITKYFNLTGEAYEGRALGVFSSALGESVGAVGMPGEHGVETRGGWMQAQANWTPKWQTNLAYGIDAINSHQLLAGARNKSQSYMGNVMYKWSPNVTFSWEWKRFLTNFRNQTPFNEQGHHVNMAIAFTF